MEAGHLREISLVWSSPDDTVQVFRCWDQYHKKVVCLKEQRCESISDFNSLLKEGVNQTSLVHPCICRLYECFLKQDQHLKCALVTDWLDKSLSLEISERAEKGNPWSEADYMELLYCVTDALAYAQERGIAHQALSPDHLYVTERGLVVVGDFSLSVRTGVEGNTALGPGAVYLSPEKRGWGQVNTPVNLFRADVYSLGVAFLAAAVLRLPQEVETAEEMRTAREADMALVHYSEKTKGILKEMIGFSSTARPDFLLLRESIRTCTGFAPIEESQTLQIRRQTFKKCLKCKRRAFQALSGTAVPLRCNPSSHLFCSPACFKAFIAEVTCDYQLDLGSVQCPKCKTPVFPEFIPQYPESTAKYYVEKQVGCGQCGADFSKSALKGEIVVLPCSPEHLFCSRLCLLDYVRQTTDDFQTIVSEPPQCPRCSQAMPVSFLVEALGGEEKFTQLISVQRGTWEGCSECTEGPVEVRLKCGHGFCKLCVRGRHEVYRIQGRKNWLCPVCREPIHPNAVSLCALF